MNCKNCKKKITLVEQFNEEEFCDSMCKYLYLKNNKDGKIQEKSAR